jgi:hypothetical protein
VWALFYLLGTETPARGPLPPYKTSATSRALQDAPGRVEATRTWGARPRDEELPGFVRPKDGARSGGTQKVLGRSTSRQEGCSGLVRQRRSSQDLRHVAGARGCVDKTGGMSEKSTPQVGSVLPSGTETPAGPLSPTSPASAIPTVERPMRSRHPRCSPGAGETAAYPAVYFLERSLSQYRLRRR